MILKMPFTRYLFLSDGLTFSRAQMALSGQMGSRKGLVSNLRKRKASKNQKSQMRSKMDLWSRFSCILQGSNSMRPLSVCLYRTFRRQRQAKEMSVRKVMMVRVSKMVKANTARERRLNILRWFYVIVIKQCGEIYQRLLTDEGNTTNNGQSYSKCWYCQKMASLISLQEKQMNDLQNLPLVLWGQSSWNNMRIMVDIFLQQLNKIMVKSTPLLRKRIVKKRTLKFTRFQSDLYGGRLAESWRRPRGIDNRMRRRFRGNKKMPKIGYGSDNATKFFLPNGLKKFVVHNAKDLDVLLMNNRTFCGEIAHNVSSRKRAEIVKRAQQIRVKLTNSRGKVRTEEKKQEA